MARSCPPRSALAVSVTAPCVLHEARVLRVVAAFGDAEEADFAIATARGGAFFAQHLAAIRAFANVRLTAIHV